MRDLAGLAAGCFRDVVGADLNVVDQDIVEVDRSWKIRARHHLIVDEEFEVVGAGWKVDGRLKGGAAFTR